MQECNIEDIHQVQGGGFWDFLKFYDNIYVF